MLLRLLPSLLALLALLFLEASAWPTPSHLHVKPAGLISLKEELHDGAQQEEYVSAGSGPLEYVVLLCLVLAINSKCSTGHTLTKCLWKNMETTLLCHNQAMTLNHGTMSYVPFSFRGDCTYRDDQEAVEGPGEGYL